MQHFVDGQCSVNLYVIVCSFVNVGGKKKNAYCLKKTFNCTGSSLWLMDFSSFGAQAPECKLWHTGLVAPQLARS